MVLCALTVASCAPDSRTVDWAHSLVPTAATFDSGPCAPAPKFLCAGGVGRLTTMGNGSSDTALIAVAMGRPDPGVGILERALHRAGSARDRNNLAVALLIRWQENGQVTDLVRALCLLFDPLEKAAAEQLVNRALALAELGLWHAAQASLSELSPAAAPGLMALARRLGLQVSQQIAQERSPNGNDLGSESAVRRLVFEGDLARASQILEAEVGSSWSRRWRVLIESVEESSWRQFSSAYRAYRDGRYGEALVVWDAMFDSPKPTPSLLASWVCTYRDLAQMSLQDSAEALVFEPCAAAVVEPAQLGMVVWRAGLSLGRAGDYPGALRAFREAERQFRAAEDPLQVANSLYLQAELLGHLAEGPVAWERRIEALHAFAGLGPSHFFHALLGDAATACGDCTGLAAVFQHERARVGEALDGWIYGFEQDFAQARISLEAGDLSRAVRHNQRAREAVERESQEHAGTVVERARMLSSLQHAEIGVAAGDGTLSVARRALARVREQNDLVWEGKALEAVGRATAAHGEVAAGLTLLWQALEHNERILARIGPNQFRLEYLENAQSSVDHLIQLLIESGRYSEALSALERAWALEDNPTQRGTTRSRAGPKTVVAHYLVTGSTLTILVRDGAGLPALMAHRQDAPALASLAHSFAAALARGDAWAEIRSASSTLYDSLIRPLQLSEHDRLVLVPDRWLGNLPFLALVDDQSNQFLGATHSVLVAPFGTRKSTLNFPKTEGANIGIVANAIDPLGLLPPLREVERESSTLQELYGARATLVTGELASAPRIKALVPTVNWIHFAMHSRPDRDVPWVESLVLADVGLKVDDLGPIRHLELVSLSVCSSAVAAPNRGRLVTGLARRFLSSGAARVVGFLWPIDDSETVELQERLHRELLGGVEPEEAVRLVVRDSVKIGAPVSGWSALQVSG